MYIIIYVIKVKIATFDMCRDKLAKCSPSVRLFVKFLR